MPTLSRLPLIARLLVVGTALVAVIIGGWMVSHSLVTEDSVEKVTAAEPVPDEVFPTPRDAAVAWAQQQSAVGDAVVDDMVVVYADTHMVDLRVKVSGDDLCRWIGIVGHGEADELAWSYGSGAGMEC